MKKVLKPQSTKSLLWKAQNIKTNRTIDKDYDFAKLAKRLKDRGISRDEVIFNPELGKGIRKTSSRSRNHS